MLTNLENMALKTKNWAVKVFIILAGSLKPEDGR
jgi:hypothetical protein